ncbi:MAG TPA: ABC transporter permease [Opitutaceae bacterium]|nr:ABC transporter permease [Opitutaceae bacterium]
MSVLTYEFILALKRLWRRRTQTGLLLATFTVSVALSLLSWSLFHTIYLKHPSFDPKGEFHVVNLIAKTPGAKPNMISRNDAEAWQATQTVFAEFTLVSLYRSIFIATEESAQRYLGALLSSESLRLMGAQPLLGRLFTADEDRIGCAPVLLLSERTWRQRFNADPDIVGRVLRVDGYDAAVVGVLPASFRFPNEQEVWLPTGFNIWEYQWPEDNNCFEGLVRLKPGVSALRAQQDLQLILDGRGPNTRAARRGQHVTVTPLREFNLLGYMHRSALILFSLSLLFVLISCANAANLVMIDFFGRSAELAAILSLGLPRGAAIRNVCFQVALVAGLAAVISLGVLWVGSPHVHGAFETMLAPYWLKFEFAWHHAAMAAALALASALVAVIVPAAYLLTAKPEEIIRAGAGASRGTGRALWRRTLILGQIAMLTVLGIAAGLLLQSNRQLGAEQRGYDAARTFLGKIDIPRVELPEQPDRLALFRRIVTEVERIPGVRGAAVLDMPLCYSSPARTRYATDPGTLARETEDGLAFTSAITEGFFAALNVPFVDGATFPREWKEGDPFYVILNESLARRLWPGRSAVGEALYLRFHWMRPEQPSHLTVVRGVTRDFQASGPQTANNDFIHVPFMSWTPSTLFLLAGGLQALPATKEINEAVWRVDPRVVPYFPDSIEHQLDLQLGFIRLSTHLTTVFAIAACLLCAVGVYSITVSQILQRSREFGIRLALGIEPGRLWLRFARDHVLTAAGGVLAGLVVAAAAMHTLGAMLYGVAARDAATYLVVGAAILLVSMLATVPSLSRLRAIKPADCLRSL